MVEQNQELRDAGLKITLPRVKILQLLESSELNSQHLSAEEVYHAFRDAGEGHDHGALQAISAAHL